MGGQKGKDHFSANWWPPRLGYWVDRNSGPNFTVHRKIVG